LEENKMANIKSAKKRILVINKKTLRNKMIVSAVKTEIKKVRAAIEAGDKAAAQAQFSQATKAIDMAASKGVYHKNNAANKKSKLQKAINKMA
jgi:small subunit ribosomal protein S20